MNCCDISDDSAWIALGLSDSSIRISSVNEKVKLKTLKPIQDLEVLDKEAGTVIIINIPPQHTHTYTKVGSI